MKRRTYWVYSMTNVHHSVLYTGVTNDLRPRVEEHRGGTGSVFTHRYNVHKLVYFEGGLDARRAIDREKQIKSGSRQRKLDLVNGANPEWSDL